MFNKIKKVAACVFVGGSLWAMVGCGGSSGEQSVPSISSVDDSTQAVFGGNELSKVFRQSVVQLPSGFTETAVTISQKSGKKSKENESDNIALDVYGGIFEYIKVSNEIKEGVVDSFFGIYSSGLLEVVALGVKHELDEGDDFSSFMLEHPKESYHWKLSLFESGSESPSAVSYFSKIGENFKGKISFKYESTKEIVIEGVTTTLSEPGVLEVIYDSTDTKKTLSIKAVNDMSESIDFAKANWSSLTSKQKDDLDLSAPEKLIINISYEDDEYSVGGTSYHGGSRVMNDLEADDFVFGTDNNTYMFAAKSKSGDASGVKLAVALPENERADLEGVFEDSSIAKAFQFGFLETINDNLARLLDDVDDASEKPEFAGDVAHEKALGAKTLIWILAGNVPVVSLSEHGNVISESELDDARNFWPEGELDSIDLNDLVGINAFFASVDGSVSQEVKESVYYYIVAPKIISEYLSRNLSITLEDIQEMIARDSEEEISFGEIFNTLLRIVNPAFFNKDNGFLGTYNGDKFFEFDAKGNKLTEGDKPDDFEALNALDLNDVEGVSPKVVFDLELTVQ